MSQNIDSFTPQFADDVVVTSIIYNESSIQTLQKDLNKILIYKIEKLILNPEKSEHMRICFKNTKNLTQNYSINNKIIKTVLNHKHLGKISFAENIMALHVNNCNYLILWSNRLKFGIQLD